MFKKLFVYNFVLSDSAEQARLHLLDVFTYAKYRFNLNSTVQISDAVEIIASKVFFNNHSFLF